MSDEEQKKPDEGVPHGMVRKTRRVRKRRRTSSEDSSESTDRANSLFAKARELLIGMQDEDEDYGPVDVAEQVRRLKKNKEDDRPLDDVWGTKKRSSSWLWIVLVGLIASVVAIVVGVVMWSKDDAGPADPLPVALGGEVGKLDDFNPGEGPLGWFNENSVGVLENAAAIIELTNNAGTVEAIEKIVRDSPFRGISPIKLSDWGDSQLTNPTSDFSWRPLVVYSSEFSGGKERGYLKVTGKREGGGRFETYFVNEEKKLLLDWDASTGWSEMPVAKIAEVKPRKPIFLRCLVEKKPTFDQSFGETKYSGYVLSGRTSDEYLFAFVALDSDKGKAIDRDFKLMLNYGSFVTDDPPLKNQKATVRVRHLPSVGEDGIFEIVEFLHDGWVTP